MRRLRRWYIPACRGQRGPAGRASPQAGAGLRAGAGARRGRRRPAARIAAAVYVSPELYSHTCLPRVCFIATAVRRSHSSCYYYAFHHAQLAGNLSQRRAQRTTKPETVYLNNAVFRRCLNSLRETCFMPYARVWVC